MLKYVIRDRRVQLDPLSIILENLKTIWEEDLSLDKHTAFKVLTYVHLCSQIDKDAPYFNANPSEVRALVKKDLFGDYEWDFGEKEEFLDECIEDYQKAYEEPEQRAVRVINRKMDQIQDKIDVTDVQIKENTVKGIITYSSNFSIINSMMLNLTKINATKETMMAAMEKQKSAGTVVRGGRKLSLLEKKLKDIKSQNLLPEMEDMDNLPDDEL